MCPRWQSCRAGGPGQNTGRRVSWSEGGMKGALVSLGDLPNILGWARAMAIPTIAHPTSRQSVAPRLSIRVTLRGARRAAGIEGVSSKGSHPLAGRAQHPTGHAGPGADRQVDSLPLRRDQPGRFRAGLNLEFAPAATGVSDDPVQLNLLRHDARRVFSGAMSVSVSWRRENWSPDRNLLRRARHPFYLTTTNWTTPYMQGHEFRQAQTAIVSYYIDKQTIFRRSTRPRSSANRGFRSCWRCRFMNGASWG